MEALQPKFSRTQTANSELSSSSTLAVSNKKIGKAPSLTGLYEFASKMGVSLSGMKKAVVKDRFVYKIPELDAAPVATVQTSTLRLDAPKDLELGLGTLQAPKTISKLNADPLAIGATIIGGTTIGFLAAFSLIESALLSTASNVLTTNQTMQATTLSAASGAAFTGLLLGVQNYSQLSEKAGVTTKQKIYSAVSSGALTAGMALIASGFGLIFDVSVSTSNQANPGDPAFVKEIQALGLAAGTSAFASIMLEVASFGRKKRSAARE